MVIAEVFEKESPLHDAAFDFISKIEVISNRLEGQTGGMMTVGIAFESPSLVCCVTAWRNKK